MKFLVLAPDAQKIDEQSYVRYQEHLDTIRDKLPISLYEMLRFPEHAYKAGKTIYDSSVVEWRDVVQTDDWEQRTEIRVLGPNFDRELLFTFYSPAILLPATDGPSFRLGELYCLEVSQSTTDSAFSFCFMYMNRFEITIDCEKFRLDDRLVHAVAH